MRALSLRSLRALAVAPLLTLLVAGCGGYAHLSGAPMSPYGGAPPPPYYPGVVSADGTANTEEYKDYGINPVVDASKDKLSTFAVDVDTASFSIARRKLVEGDLPPPESVRVEEFVNYFDYGYDAPKDAPFGVTVGAAPSPYTPGHHLVRIGLQGKQVSGQDRLPVHLVYLVDTSGSMMSDDKMGLVKKSLRILTDSLQPGDTIALCTYAGSVSEVLAPTGMDKKAQIQAAIEQLTAGGSTAMSSGIDLAYSLAKKTLVKGAVNRVVVLSDGDANVGPSTYDELVKQIEQYKDQGITLSTVGFGAGNYKDTTMEQLADKGDGNYSYIDSEEQAVRVFGHEVNGLLQVIARDVKVQVEFDPKVVKEYRLVGYENRDVKDKDFRNDKVDGGEIGAGHDVTALYDVVLASTDASPLTVHVRWKPPSAGDAKESAFVMPKESIATTFATAPGNLRFAVGVMGFAELLRKSPLAKEWTYAQVRSIVKEASGSDADRAQLLDLVARAEKLAGQQ